MKEMLVLGMHKRLICLGVIVLMLLGGQQHQTLAEPGTAPYQPPQIEFEMEYMGPYDKDRMIETVSTDLLVPLRVKTPFSNCVLYHGMTLTRSWGKINRDEIDPDSSAFGVGPVCLARFQWLEGYKWQLFTDFSGALIFYSKAFPAGADIYDFMWRLSPKIAYHIKEKLDLIVGYQIMHISNGQMSNHIPTRNPGYNALGVTISLNRRF